MRNSADAIIDPELISIMLVFGVSLGLFASFGLIKASTATLLFWLLSQGRIFSRFAGLRRSGGCAGRYFMANQLHLVFLTILLGFITKQ